MLAIFAVSLNGRESDERSSYPQNDPATNIQHPAPPLSRHLSSFIKQILDPS
jgi:hypothetical protein